MLTGPNSQGSIKKHKLAPGKNVKRSSDNLGVFVKKTDGTVQTEVSTSHIQDDSKIPDSIVATSRHFKDNPNCPVISSIDESSTKTEQQVCYEQ